ncbi:MAG: PAS domain S-box protein [Oligoflexia bacterium]|nr:PAS domain S-box protein [Oligoflexia bacterium]
MNETAVLQAFVDCIASSVAVVAKGAGKALIVVACNEDFLAMTGGSTRVANRPPFPIDALLPRYAMRHFGRVAHRCITQGKAQEYEQAFDLRDSTRWWRLTLKPFRDPNDGSIGNRLLVTGMDITPKMELQKALEISTQRFKSVIGAAYDAIVTVDQRQRVTMFNRAAEDLFGYDEDEVLGEHLEMLLPEGARAQHDALVEHFATSPVQSRQMDERDRVYGRHRDGSEFPVEIAISKIIVDGRTEFTAIIRDIIDKVRLLQLLEKQAATDPLTGLVNRRGLFEASEKMIHEARRDGTDFRWYNPRRPSRHLDLGVGALHAVAWDMAWAARTGETEPWAGIRRRSGPPNSEGGQVSPARS